jgi:hypothetical protein
MKLQVADSGFKEVDQLVLQLVSRRPAPLPVSGVEVPQKFSMSELSHPNGRYQTEDVATAVREILSKGCEGSFYKIRDGKTDKSLGPPNFWECVESAGGVEKWAAKAAKQTRSQIEVGFIDWCLMIERERGFVDEVQEKELMDRYQQRREQALQRK